VAVCRADFRANRARLLAAGGRIRFPGSKPYGELKSYARSVDVAVLPYMKREPTYSGSSTRFYEHLAACRPILATDGFEELLHKEPLLKILRSPAQWVRALQELHDKEFRDGLEELRWRQSQDETWEARVERLRDAMLPRQAARGASARGVPMGVPG
jgi:glycosyltransferase involved in cell wall biosynthesis